MKLIQFLALLGLMSARLAVAGEPPSTAQELDFSPPPVPAFMLYKPEKPLTLDEMKKQADEAARRARAEKAEPPGADKNQENK